MYVSLKRFLAQNIEIRYDDNLDPIMVIGCTGDFSLIQAFCEEVLEDDDVFDTFLEDIHSRDDGISCDCEYLLSTDADYIVTDDEWLPLNPN